MQFAMNCDNPANCARWHVERWVLVAFQLFQSSFFQSQAYSSVRLSVGVRVSLGLKLSSLVVCVLVLILTQMSFCWYDLGMTHTCTTYWRPRAYKFYIPMLQTSNLAVLLIFVLLVSLLVLTKCQVLNLRVSRSHDQVLQRAYYSSFILGSKITFCRCK